MWCIEKKKLKSEKIVSKEEAELKGLDSQPMVIWIMSKCWTGLWVTWKTNKKGQQMLFLQNLFRQIWGKNILLVKHVKNTAVKII